jgi:hypothetical protein
MPERSAKAKLTPVRRRERAASEAEAQRRRTRNRENMRQLRANPAYRAFEKRRRDQRLEGGAPKEFFDSTRSGGESGAEAVRRCSICGKRDAVEIITRLRPSAETKSGFVQMRIAYCGFC